MKLSIITPVGGSEEEANLTVASVRLAALENPIIDFEHILVLNNSVCFTDFTAGEPNLRRLVRDISPVANRSIARNTGVMMAAADSDFTLFLDSGDMLLPEAVRHLDPEARVVHSFSSLVMSGNSRFLRTVKSKDLIGFINPYYIGSTWVPTALARQHNFSDGRKEDWKLWLSLHRANVQFAIFPQINYVYTVKSRRDHAFRKMRLITDQYEFFRNSLNKSVGSSIVALAIHYSILIVFWFGVQRSELEPLAVDNLLNEINALAMRSHPVSRSSHEQ